MKIKHEVTISFQGPLEIVLREGHHHRPHLFIPIGPFSIKEGLPEVATIAVALTDIQQVQVGPVTGAKDLAGKDIPLAGPVTYTSDDESICSVAPALDDAGNPIENAALLVSGDPGATVVHATDGVATDDIAVAVGTSAEGGFDMPVGDATNKPGF